MYLKAMVTELVTFTETGLISLPSWEQKAEKNTQARVQNLARAKLETTS